MRFRITNSFIFSLSITLLTVQLTYAQDIANVKKVVDGDTLLLTNGKYVRLIGVDTPETKHPQKPVEYFGKEAFQFTKGMVEGKEVRLEYDQTRRDRYNRILGLCLSHGWNLPECRDHQAGVWVCLE
jgi:endonuclease YncB( thermonuclease family)